MNEKSRVIMLGCAFIFFLTLAYFENILFLGNLRNVFTNPPLAVAMIFMHNVIAVSLIIIGMSFYVDFVQAFLPKRRVDYVVLDHPNIFAAIFTSIILVISILRVYYHVYGRIVVDVVEIIMMISLPHGVVEAYGIYKAIHVTLAKNLTNKMLIKICLIFLLAAFLEVGFIQVLKIFT
ncbi:MAG: hypothetical protein QXK89_00435 [Candidatus Bathyarchaeia archaeon]|nr:hypothetical protein [Candidatus Bathyarchaeota archaeon]